MAKKKPAGKKPAKKAAPKKAPAKKPAGAKPVRNIPKIIPAPPAASPAASGYAGHRAAMAVQSREKSQTGREIGPLPDVVDPERKARCAGSLRAFCETYFPRRFFLGWSCAHITAIERLERCARNGGRFALAMPRGSGKSTLAEVAAVWAILNGFRRFVVIVAATGELAESILGKIKAEIETNDLLAEDYPEACYPVRMLEGIHNRAKGQTLGGERTRIGWTADGLSFPVVPGAPGSGSVVRVAGLTGAVRGLSTLAPDGTPIRPDLVLLDDPQTRASAKSPAQTHDREQTILGDVLGLAGPTTQIAVVMPCTVIYPRDLAARFLDRQARPEWHGERTQMLESLPDNLELWREYKDVLDASHQAGHDGEEATAFYEANRAEMDAGAVPSWNDRFLDGHVSAVQTAMTLYLTNRREFLAEYQNDPEAELSAAGAKSLCAPAVAARLSGLPRCEVPREAVRITAMVDAGQHLHWFAVVAWDQKFGGSVIDYGAWPQQNRRVFEAADPRPSLADLYPNRSAEEVVYAGLLALTDHVLNRVYRREGTGEELRVERSLVDCGWQAETVHQFCRQSAHAGILYPSKGVGRTTTARGVGEWKPRAGERTAPPGSPPWRLTVSETGRGRMVQFDPDAWKSFLYDRFTTGPGGAGYLTLYGRTADEHELLGEHCAAEYALPVTIRGATFDKWQVQAHRPPNHFFDALVGAAVAASVQGQRFDSGASSGHAMPPRPPKKKVDIEALYQKANPGESW